jgi:hypothetical protein
MKTRHGWRLVAAGCLLGLAPSCRGDGSGAVTVPFELDHNRVLVDARIQREDGSWRDARLMVDSGNPEFSISDSLARDLGLELSEIRTTPQGHFLPQDVPPFAQLTIGGKPLDVAGIGSKARFGPIKAFFTTHCDGNLPSTLLRRYHVVFDYPGRTLTIADPGSLDPRGVRVPIEVDEASGILQIDVTVGADSLSLALDNGASYSCMSEAALEGLAANQAGWPRIIGATGCANMWGHWPAENRWPIVRIPEIRAGAVRFEEVGMTGLPDFFTEGGRTTDLGTWYSRKTARPVAGFLGPNALRAFRVEIDYAHGACYLERDAGCDLHDMDIVGLTLNPEPDGRFVVVGIVQVDGRPAVEGVEPGDVLLRIDGRETAGATFGTVVDALRGEPGEIRRLEVDRDGRRLQVDAEVARLL